MNLLGQTVRTLFKLLPLQIIIISVNLYSDSDVTEVSIKTIVSIIQEISLNETAASRDLLLDWTEEDFFSEKEIALCSISTNTAAVLTVQLIKPLPPGISIFIEALSVANGRGMGPIELNKIEKGQPIFRLQGGGTAQNIPIKLSLRASIQAVPNIHSLSLRYELIPDPKN